MNNRAIKMADKNVGW